jgi:hypothetical protein
LARLTGFECNAGFSGNCSMEFSEVWQNAATTNCLRMAAET